MYLKKKNFSSEVIFLPLINARRTAAEFFFSPFCYAFSAN